MEASLEDLFAPIPPLPDEVADLPKLSKRSSKESTSDKEEKLETTRMDDVLRVQPLVVADAFDSSALFPAADSSTLPLSKPAANEKRKEEMTDIDSSRTSSDRVQENPNSMRELVQQAKDREGRYTTTTTTDSSISLYPYILAL